MAMKVRDSGMPEETVWEGFFDARHILSQLSLTDGQADVVDFGCGYGTFTIAAADSPAALSMRWTLSQRCFRPPPPRQKPFGSRMYGRFSATSLRTAQA
jgi:hypothetical protein